MKRKKRDINKKIPTKKIIVVLICVSLIIFLLIFNNFFLTTKVIEKHPIPEECSNESIKEVWEGIFKGNSENLTIIYPHEEELNTTFSSYLESLSELDRCPTYVAYKINENNLKIILGLDIWFMMDIKLIMAMNGEFDSETINDIKDTDSHSKEFSKEDENYPFFNESFFEDGALTRNIETIEEAKSHFESIFNISSSEWIKDGEEKDFIKDYNSTIYRFSEEESIENITIFGESIDPIGNYSKEGYVYGNKSLDYYIYFKISVLGVIESLSKKYENWTSPINTSISNIKIKINESDLELLKDYKETQKVEIIENNKTIVETSINFTGEGYFHWEKIRIKKQEENSSVGYLIINGLNSTKNVTIDKLSNKSDSVCIKDQEINDINEISSNCNSTDEYLINCPGNLGNFSCKIYGDKFIVTGLMNSGVIEIIPSEEICIQNWQCENWSKYDDYGNECGNRTCIDLNNCSNLSGKPLEYKECFICIPKWNCTDFLPEKCPKNEIRTRNCTDLNNCEKNENMPVLTQKCERENNWIWIMIGTLSTIGIILLFILLIKIKKRNKISNFSKIL